MVDTLTNPFALSVWSAPEILDIIELTGCVFQGASPRWSSDEMVAWYKAPPTVEERHDKLRENWVRTMPYRLFGLPPEDWDDLPVASPSVYASIGDLVENIREYRRDRSSGLDGIAYPEALSDYLSESKNPLIISLDSELREIYQTVANGSASEIKTAWHNATTVRERWGAVYHYFAFSRPVESSYPRKSTSP